MNSTKRETQRANLYDVCNDGIRRGVLLNRKKIARKNNSLAKEGSQLILDNDKDDDDIYRSRGIAIPPDEVLLAQSQTGIKIPIRHREEFPKDAPLPLAELLKAIHYYASKRVSKLPSEDKIALERSLDETALLGFGVMVEELADSYIDENGVDIFVENDEDSEDKEEQEEESEEEDKNEVGADDSTEISSGSDDE